MIEYINKKEHSKAINISATGVEAGTPDIDAVIQGKSFKIEIKQPNQPKQKDLQRYRMVQWANAGSKVIYAETYEKVIEAIETEMAFFYTDSFGKIYISKKLTLGGYFDMLGSCVDYNEI